MYAYILLSTQFMTDEEKSVIKDLGKCNFTAVHSYFKMKTEERKARSKEEKQVCQPACLDSLCIVSPLANPDQGSHSGW